MSAVYPNGIKLLSRVGVWETTDVLVRPTFGYKYNGSHELLSETTHWATIPSGLERSKWLVGQQWTSYSRHTDTINFHTACKSVEWTLPDDYQEPLPLGCCRKRLNLLTNRPVTRSVPVTLSADGALVYENGSEVLICYMSFGATMSACGTRAKWAITFIDPLINVSASVFRF